MTTPRPIRLGDRVRQPNGVFAGREGTVVNAPRWAIEMYNGDLPQGRVYVLWDERKRRALQEGRAPNHPDNIVGHWTNEVELL